MNSKFFFLFLLMTTTLTTNAALAYGDQWQVAKTCEQGAELLVTYKQASGGLPFRPFYSLVIKDQGVIQYLKEKKALENYNYDPYARGEMIVASSGLPLGATNALTANSFVEYNNRVTGVLVSSRRYTVTVEDHSVVLKIEAIRAVNAKTGDIARNPYEEGGIKIVEDGEVANWTFRNCR